MNLNALLGDGMPDAVAFGERIFKQLQDRLVSDGTLPDISDMPAQAPEDLIATVVGDWLTRVIGNTDALAMPARPASGDRDQDRLFQELRDRNVALASALGACGNCWGTRAGCPVCDGAGAPGWALPDEELYLAYVHPATARIVTNPHGSVAVRGPDGRN